MKKNEFTTEWCLLQNQFDSYEKHSLYIKLVSVAVLLMAEMSGDIDNAFAFILLVLWLQDAIWKTFQSRIEPRLLQIEKNILEDKHEGVCQFNREYYKARLKGKALIAEYLSQSIRPTVAFPHVFLLFIFMLNYLE
jgi:hypothetical protein